MVKHAEKSVSAPVKTRVYDLLKEMIYNEDDQIRSSSARILGIISEVSIILPVIIILRFIRYVLGLSYLMIVYDG